jgi:hypothetical protein
VWAPVGSRRERERRGAGRVAGPKKKEVWAEPKEHEHFLFIQINFKLVQIILIKSWTYQAPKNSNKICLKRV